MVNFIELTRVPPDRSVPFTDQPRLAVAAYPARFTGSSREHTESDLRCHVAGAPSVAGAAGRRARRRRWPCRACC